MDFVEVMGKKMDRFWRSILNSGGPPESRTRHQRIMLTTTVFTARFRFVVWTVSCRYDLPVQSLHLPNIAVWLGSGSPRIAAEVSPNLSSSTQRQSELALVQPICKQPWREALGCLLLSPLL